MFCIDCGVLLVVLGWYTVRVVYRYCVCLVLMVFGLGLLCCFWLFAVVVVDYWFVVVVWVVVCCLCCLFLCCLA